MIERLNQTGEEALRVEARDYITHCLSEGIMLGQIEAPLGLLGECRRVFGPAATVWKVAGNDWIAEVAAR